MAKYLGFVQGGVKGYNVNDVIEKVRDKPEGRLVNQNGQRIGAKGQRTRQRLIDVTVDLLQTHGLRDLTVAEVARVAETSPATFYVYFDGVPEVVLSALENSNQTSPRLLALVDEDWVGNDGLGKACEFVELYCALWNDNGTIFRVRNLAAEEGDPRFIEARRNSVRHLLDRLARHINAARDAGRVAPNLDGLANAAAILILLERFAAVGSLINEQEGPHYNQIKESAADMIAHAMGAI